MLLPVPIDLPHVISLMILVISAIEMNIFRVIIIFPVYH